MQWDKQEGYTDIIYEKGEGMAKITINRPEKRKPDYTQYWANL